VQIGGAEGGWTRRVGGRRWDGFARWAAGAREQPNLIVVGSSRYLDFSLTDDTYRHSCVHAAFFY